jgi:uncharacterized protein
MFYPMKKLLVILLSVVFVQTNGQDLPHVYYTSDISPQGLEEVFSYIKDECHGNIAFKVHFGEEGNRNFLSPELMRELVIDLKATLVETNVLYVSKRRYTESHIQLARDHGFDYAPIDILDSSGDSVVDVKTEHFDKVITGKNFFHYDTYVIFSHFKGHGSAGFGGAIKNVSMGLASVAGKMALHASDIPGTNPEKCINCGVCVRECPADAITLNPLTIDKTKCIGCAKCIGECPVSAFSIPWGSTPENIFLERLVEYAMVLSSLRKMVYVNVLANISRSCDCSRHAPKPFMEDIGILVSTDIVAIEKASHDLVDMKCQCDDAFVRVGNPSGKHQINYAFEKEMGNINYILIDINKD